MYTCKLTQKGTPVGDKLGIYLERLEASENKLNSAKNTLDEPYKYKNAGRIMRKFEAFTKAKFDIARDARNYNISNAWIKAYEIYNGFPLITKDILHFDNAAFPGSFMLAAHHYTKTVAKKEYKWVASSLLDKNDQNLDPLEDMYQLYKNYPDNWLMTKENNGDVLNINNIYDWKKVQCDLYTSDLGFDVSSDYNAQEKMHSAANLGQIMAGLSATKPGGCFCTKQYTMYQPITISMMWFLSGLFEDFYVCKPIASKPDNSETYLIGKNYKPDSKIFDIFVNKLATFKSTGNKTINDKNSDDKTINDKNTNDKNGDKTMNDSEDQNNDDKKTIKGGIESTFWETPLIDLKEVSEEFMAKIVDINETLEAKQSKKIAMNVSMFNKVKDMKPYVAEKMAASLAAPYIKKTISTFKKKNKIFPMNSKYIIHMKDVFGQYKF